MFGIISLPKQIKQTCDFKMCSKSVLLLGLLLISFRAVQSDPISDPISKSIQEESIVFELNKTVQVNGSDFKELNCIAHDSSTSKCLTITEVTCWKELGQIRSCSVSNKNSPFFSSSIVNRTVFCNDTKEIKGNCRLIFSLDSTFPLDFAGVQSVISNPIQPIVEEHTKQVLIAISVFVGVFSLFFFIVVSCLILMWWQHKRHEESNEEYLNVGCLNPMKVVKKSSTTSLSLEGLAWKFVWINKIVKYFKIICLQIGWNTIQIISIRCSCLFCLFFLHNDDN